MKTYETIVHYKLYPTSLGCKLTIEAENEEEATKIADRICLRLQHGVKPKKKTGTISTRRINRNSIIMFTNSNIKPKKIYLIRMIAEGMDFSIVTRAFRYKTEANSYCNYYNNICEDRCYSWEETMLYE